MISAQSCWSVSPMILIGQYDTPLRAARRDCAAAVWARLPAPAVVDLRRCRQDRAVQSVAAGGGAGGWGRRGGDRKNRGPGFFLFNGRGAGGGDPPETGRTPPRR